MDAVVFVGPSLDPREVASVLLAELLPPVKRGDVARVAARAEPPACVGIVDGAFLHDLSISPKEILRAIDHGIRFFGSSSMGALRAVELEPFGMVGVGRIFSLFRSGEIEADDEVAVTYDPETLRPLSEPMVNIRVAVAAAVERGLVSPRTGKRCVQVAKDLYFYFPHRTTAAVLRTLDGEIDRAEHARLARFLAEQAPDAKREDALALLERMRQELAAAGGTGSGAAAPAGGPAVPGPPVPGPR